MFNLKSWLSAISSFLWGDAEYVNSGPADSIETLRKRLPKREVLDELVCGKGYGAFIRATDREQVAMAEFILAVLDAPVRMEGDENHPAAVVRPVMFIDGSISPADVEKLTVAIERLNGDRDCMSKSYT